MSLWHAEAVIDAAPDLVWSTLTELAHLKSYVKGLQRSAPANSEPLGRRFVYMEHRKMAGRVQKVRITIDAWDPPRLVARTGHTPFGDFTYTYRLEPFGGATRITQDATHRARSPVHHLTAWFAIRIARANDRDTLTRLKAACERRAAEIP